MPIEIADQAGSIAGVDAYRPKLEQHAVTLFALAQFAVRTFAASDVFDSEKHGWFIVVPILHLAGIEEHGFSSQVREVVLDFKIDDWGVFGKDFVKHGAQLRDVPLPIPQLIQKPSLRVFQ